MYFYLVHLLLTTTNRRHSSVDNATVKRQRDAMRTIRSRMGNRLGLGVPVRRTFVEPRDGGPSPLAALISGRRAQGGGGGRGGRTRLALYLSVMWVAATPPFEATRPSRFWADLAGIPAPDDAAARRAVSNAWRDLASRRFISWAPGSAAANQLGTVGLMCEDGSGAPYTIPDPKLGTHEFYFRLPEDLWARGALAEMTGPALTMYVVILSRARRDQPDQEYWFSPPAFRTRYGLSDATRKQGLNDLVELGVLDLQQRTVDATGGIGQRRFRRNIYRLLPSYGPPSVAPR